MTAQVQYLPTNESGYYAAKLYEHLQYYDKFKWKRYNSYQSLQIGPTRVLRIWYVAPRTARLEVCHGLYALLATKLKGWRESNHSSKFYTHQCPIRQTWELKAVADAVVSMFQPEEQK